MVSQITKESIGKHVISSNFPPEIASWVAWTTSEPPWASKVRGFFSTHAHFEVSCGSWGTHGAPRHALRSSKERLGASKIDKKLCFLFKNGGPTSEICYFSRCHRFLVVSCMFIPRFFIGFWCCVFVIFCIGIDVFFGLFFDASFTLLQKTRKLKACVSICKLRCFARVEELKNCSITHGLFINFGSNITSLDCLKTTKKALEKHAMQKAPKHIPEIAAKSSKLASKSRLGRVLGASSSVLGRLGSSRRVSSQCPAASRGVSWRRVASRDVTRPTTVFFARSKGFARLVRGKPRWKFPPTSHNLKTIVTMTLTTTIFD